MTWEPRTLDELRLLEARRHNHGTDLVVYVNTEEALLLHAAGATVAGSGSVNLERGTQRYRFEGKLYFWLAGNGSEKWEDDYPVSSGVDPRITQAVVMQKRMGS